MKNTPGTFDITISAKSSKPDEDTKSEVEVVKDLKNYIEFKTSNVQGIAVEHQREEIQPGKAGALLAATLHILLGKELLTKIADIIKEWVSKRSEVIKEKKRV